jgi:hypothetical protein
MNLERDSDVPEDTVIITIDDGYQSVYSEMYPVAVEEEVPISLFMTTGFVYTDDMFWWDKADIACQKRGDLPPNHVLKDMRESECRQLIAEQFCQE